MDETDNDLDLPQEVLDARAAVVAAWAEEHLGVGDAYYNLALAAGEVKTNWSTADAPCTDLPWCACAECVDGLNEAYPDLPTVRDWVPPFEDARTPTAIDHDLLNAQIDYAAEWLEARGLHVDDVKRGLLAALELCRPDLTDDVRTHSGKETCICRDCLLAFAETLEGLPMVGWTVG